MNTVNYSAVALVCALSGLAINSLVWALTGHPWAGVGFVIGMLITWAGRSWAFD